MFGNEFGVSSVYVNSKGLDTQTCFVPCLVYPIWKSRPASGWMIQKWQFFMTWHRVRCIFTTPGAMSVMYFRIGDFLERKHDLGWPGWRSQVGDESVSFPRAHFFVNIYSYFSSSTLGKWSKKLQYHWGVNCWCKYFMTWSIALCTNLQTTFKDSLASQPLKMLGKAKVTEKTAPKKKKKRRLNTWNAESSLPVGGFKFLS